MELIYVEPDYFGIDGYYNHDIAVVVLSTGFMLNKIVSPVCLDWGQQYTILHGSQGKVNTKFHMSSVPIKYKQISTIDNTINTTYMFWFLMFHNL